MLINGTLLQSVTNNSVNFYNIYIYILKKMHLADTFIQSDLTRHCRFTIYQFMHSLRIRPTTLILLVPCFTFWATGNWAALCHSGKVGNVTGNHLWAGAGWEACRTRQRWAQHESPSRWAAVSQAHPSQSLPSPNNQNVFSIILILALSSRWELQNLI